MAFHSDLTRLLQITRGGDPSFAAVTDHTLRAQFKATEQAADQGQDAFLLQAMRLMALSGNGHSRVLPHNAIQTLPLRMVAIGDDIALADGGRVLSVNGIGVADLCDRARPYLSGTPARQRAITPMLLAWPAAIRTLTVCDDDETVFEVEGIDHKRRQIVLRTDDTAPALNTYPIAETGQLHPTPRAPFAVSWVGGALHIALRDLKAMTPVDAHTILDQIRAAPASTLIIDLRGNPGGSFFNAIPLIDGLTTDWHGDHCGVLVDKFTFSAAIVCTALLVHRLGARATVMGEPMGDGLRFYAEGDTDRLTDSGADLRYSTQAHDWETGHADPTLSPDIAAVQVGIGPLCITPLPFSAAALAQGRDVTIKAALDALST